MRWRPLLSSSVAIVFLACTSDDTPTEPGSIAAAAKQGGLTLTEVSLGLPDVWSAAFALNNLGQVVGTRSSEFEGPGPAFLWDHGTVTDLGTLGGSSARAWAINDLSQIVGDATTADGQTHAFLWDHGTMRDLGIPESDLSGAIDINNAGQILGGPVTRSGDNQAFVWEDGAVTILGSLGGIATYPTAINNHGEVVGSGQTALLNPFGQPIEHAFIWSQGIMTDLGTLGGFFSRAEDINDGGQVVGISDTRRSNGELHGFLWEDGKMKDLGANFHPSHINNGGQIVGSNPTLELLLWDRGKLTRIVPEGFAYGMNDSTTIAGESGGRNRHAVIWTR